MNERIHWNTLRMVVQNMQGNLFVLIYLRENPLGLILLLDVPMLDLKAGDLNPGDLAEDPLLVPPNISQKRIVSSAPADTIVLPSGEDAMCSTLEL